MPSIVYILNADSATWNVWEPLVFERTRISKGTYRKGKDGETKLPKMIK